ncbi:O-antigen ligase family protein [Thermodesulfobacteriota bacterium]
MNSLLVDLISLVSESQVYLGFVLLAILAAASVAMMIILTGRHVPGRRILLVGLALGIPIMTPMLMESTRSSFFAMNMSFADLLIVPVILYILYSLIRWNKPIELPLFWLFLAYFLWGVISLYIGCLRLDIEFVKFTNLVNMVKFLALFIYFFMVVNLIDDLDDWKIFLKSWVIAAAIVGLIGIGGSLLYLAFHVDTFAAGQFRAKGTLGNPNMFGGYLKTSFFLAYIYLVLGVRKLPYVLIMIILGIATLLSASKGSVVGLLVGCLALLLFIPRHRKKILAMTVAVLVVTTAAYFASEHSRIYLDRLLSITEVDSKSHQSRLKLWGISLKIFEENYLVGAGRGNFSKAYPDDFEAMEMGKTKWDAIGIGQKEKEYGVTHSTYLSLLCEMGLPGLIGFLAIMLFFVRILLRRIMTLDPMDVAFTIQATLMAALLSVLAQGGVANVENSRSLWALLGIILAYDVKILKRAYAHSAPSSSPESSGE